jgi:hypothetical protein
MNRADGDRVLDEWRDSVVNKVPADLESVWKGKIDKFSKSVERIRDADLKGCICGWEGLEGGRKIKGFDMAKKFCRWKWGIIHGIRMF